MKTKKATPFRFTVVIPAYNEEKNITAAIGNVVRVAESFTKDYEILVYDDGSSDATSSVAGKLAGRNKRIRVIRCKNNLGLGHSLREAIKQSKKDYLTVFPGDNDMSSQSLRSILTLARNFDLVFSYPKDSKRRSFIRRLTSSCYVTIMNMLFGLKLKYYTGPWVSKVSLLRTIPIRSDGFSVYAEVKIRLIRKGCRYKEIPFEHVGRKFGRSKAFRFRNIVQVFYTIAVLFKS